MVANQQMSTFKPHLAHCAHKPASMTEHTQEETCIGVDLGDKRTGIAVAERSTGLASPVEVIVEADRQRLARRVADIAAEYGADRLVVGLPINMDGTEGPRAKLCRTFAEMLAGLIPHPVELFDERLTSAAAEEDLAGMGFTRDRKKRLRDALAACHLLRAYLAASSDDQHHEERESPSESG